MTDEKIPYNFLINNVMRITKSTTNRYDKLFQICKLLHNSVSYYNWVGFYLTTATGSDLKLGPFIGDPTEHTTIPFGKGICGQAAVAKETFLVQDV